MPSSYRRVFIVISIYNLEKYILDCLDSLRRQTYTDWQAVVIDDGSSDAGPARVKEWARAQADPRVSLVRQTNQGVAAARNHGLALAAGEFVLFLDGDDRLHPTALERLVGALIEAPGAVASYGSYRVITEDGLPHPRQIDPARLSLPSGNLLPALISGNFLANGGHVLIRRRAAEQIGGFKIHLRKAEDWDFFARLAACGSFRAIAAEPEVLGFRERRASKFRSHAASPDAALAALGAILDDPLVRAALPAGGAARLRRRAEAGIYWTVGRENIRQGDYRVGRQFLRRALRRHPNLHQLMIYAATYPLALGMPVPIRQLLPYDRTA